MKTKIAIFIATAGYAGYARKAPGTWGSLVGILLAWPILALGGLVALAAFSFVGYFVGVWAADVYESHTGRHDPQEIVIDEVVGQWLTLLIAVLLYPLLEMLVPMKLIPAESYLDAVVIQHQFLHKLAHLLVLHPSMLLFAWIGMIVLKISVPAFLMFRLCDITKPGFIGQVDEQVQGGMGTMLDDALAGLLAGVLVPFLWLILHWIAVWPVQGGM